MIIKTCELEGAALDWAVAQAACCETFTDAGGVLRHGVDAKGWSPWWIPSTDWGQGGLLIDQYNLTVSSPKSSVHRHGGPLNGWGESGMWMACTWHKGVSGKRSFGRHETSPLVAACRAIVASELGDEVDVPDEIAKRGG